MKKVYTVRQMIVSLVAFVILIWAFFKNQFFGKVIITPFLICAFAIFMENLFSILGKEKISDIFKLIFRISLFAYIFGFLSYAIYYSITTKSYSLLIVVAVFLLFIIPFFKKIFFRR